MRIRTKEQISELLTEMVDKGKLHVSKQYYSTNTPW